MRKKSKEESEEKKNDGSHRGELRNEVIHLTSHHKVATVNLVILNTGQFGQQKHARYYLDPLSFQPLSSHRISHFCFSSFSSFSISYSISCVSINNRPRLPPTTSKDKAE